MQRIESIDDPRVAAYRNLPDRTLRGESIFVSEGRLVTHRLLESGCTVDSLLVTEPHVAEFAPLAGERIPLYVAREELLRDVVGFNFHLGVMAVGRRPAARGWDDFLARIDRPGPLSLVVCPEITKPENMGLVFRTAGALGVDGVVLGRQSCDPYSRRCLRVSMGAVLQLPFARCGDLLADLPRMKERLGMELAASLLDPAAVPLAAFRWPRRVGLLLGNEFDGLRQSCLALCEHRVTIPMTPHVDSLNLGVAAGIFLYELRKQHAAEAE